MNIAGEHVVTNTQMVCGEIFGLTNGFLCEIKEIEKAREEYPEDEDDTTAGLSVAP